MDSQTCAGRTLFHGPPLGLPTLKQSGKYGIQRAEGEDAHSEERLECPVRRPSFCSPALNLPQARGNERRRRKDGGEGGRGLGRPEVIWQSQIWKLRRGGRRK